MNQIIDFIFKHESNYIQFSIITIDEMISHKNEGDKKFEMHIG